MAIDAEKISEAVRLRGVCKRSSKRALNEALRTASPSERRTVRSMYNAARCNGSEESTAEQVPMNVGHGDGMSKKEELDLLVQQAAKRCDPRTYSTLKRKAMRLTTARKFHALVRDARAAAA